jgi:mRNA interferase YafQ
MRTIERSNAFKRDWKREAKGKHRAILDDELLLIIEALAEDKPLEARHRDHVLSGNWNGFCECHVKADLLLIYRKPDEKTLQLARLGSHSQLFG